MPLLLIGGTGEGRALAAALAARGVPHAVWMPRDARADPAGAAHDPGPLQGPLDACLERVRPDAVLDASHPFAAPTSHAAARYCADRAVPYCLLRRPEWQPQPGDAWSHVADDTGAAALIAPGSTLLIASGREGLGAYSALERCRVHCRQIGAPGIPFPLPDGDWLIQEPPFAVVDEVALFQRLGIDWLVLRNSGAEAAKPKLTAARLCGVRVAMIARPAPPDALIVQTVDEALAWVAGS